jgi:hypothetical protein
MQIGKVRENDTKNYSRVMAISQAREYKDHYTLIE